MAHLPVSTGEHIPLSAQDVADRHASRQVSLRLRRPMLSDQSTKSSITSQSSVPRWGGESKGYRTLSDAGVQASQGVAFITDVHSRRTAGRKVASTLKAEILPLRALDISTTELIRARAHGAPSNTSNLQRGKGRPNGNISACVPSSTTGRRSELTHADYAETESLLKSIASRENP